MSIASRSGQIQVEQLIEALNARSGAFAEIVGYESGTKSKCDYVVNVNTNYDNFLQRSYDFLFRLRNDESQLHQHIKILSTDRYTFLTVLDALMKSFQERMRKTDEDRKIDSQYEQLGAGLMKRNGKYYIAAMEVPNTKIVRQQGEHKEVEHKSDTTAIKKYLNDLLPVSRLRTFKLDGNFDCIKINKQRLG